MTLYYRAGGSRTEHIANPNNILVTLCGIATTAGAKYRDADRGVDAKIWSTCKRCKAVLG